MNESMFEGKIPKSRLFEIESLISNKVSNCVLSYPNGEPTYSGNVITAKANTKVLIPNGINSDGTLNNILYILPNDTISTSYLSVETVGAFLNYNGNVDLRLYTVSEETPDTSKGWIWFKPSENKFYRNVIGGEFTPTFVCYIGSVVISDTSGTISSFTPIQPVQLATVDFVNNKIGILTENSLNINGSNSTSNTLTNIFTSSSEQGIRQAQTYNIQTISETGGTINLVWGVYNCTISTATVFNLPVSPVSGYQQIKLILAVSGTPTINWGTTIFYNGNTPDISTAGYYHCYWDYDPISSKWVCGVMKEG